MPTSFAQSTDPDMVTQDDPDGFNGGQPAFSVAQSDETNELIKKQVNDMLNRSAEESIYASKGEALDYLNKPVELFKLTCTDGGANSKDGSGNVVTLPTFDFTKNIWTAFCADATDIGGAAKCLLQQFLQTQFNSVIKTINKFKDQTFCEAFTTFVNNQANQCLKINFNMPRGQFPGFPALNQCLFGSLHLSVSGNGVYARSSSGTLKRLADTYSAHAFSYANVSTNSTTGFGGSEQQLLGTDGAAAIMKASNWNQAKQLEALKATQTAGASCQNTDPQLIAALNEWAPPNMILIGGISSVIGQKKAAGGAIQQRIVAKWNNELNTVTNDYQAMLSPGADLTYTDRATGSSVSIGAAGGWSRQDGTYTYLASCYGFSVNLDSSTCADPSSDSFNQLCNADANSLGCCDPDKTSCADMNTVELYDDSGCTTYKKDTAGKDTTVCLSAHRKGDKKAIKKPQICPQSCTAPTGTTPAVCTAACCNPGINDCLLLATENPGLKICDKYVPPKQCLTATPEQLKALDPAYSSLPVRPQANLMIDGQACCTTEWCNLCPQDIIMAGAGISPARPGSVYIKESELAGVPKHCLNPRNTGAATGEVNAALPPTLEPLPDQIYDNTQEACELMKTQGWDAKKVFNVFIFCPSLSSQTGLFLDNIINKANNAINDCPDGATVKPYSQQVINFGVCNQMASITKYPTPITKISKVEGADPIGLCSDLNLCPAAIPNAEDPLSVGGHSAGALQRGAS